MAKRSGSRKATGRRGNSVADKIAIFIGSSLGNLLREKDRLVQRLSVIDDEIATVSSKVSEQLGRYAGPKAKAAAPAKRAKKTGPRKQARKQISDETRAKMAAAARKRWAGRKKAGKAKSEPA